MKRDDVETIIHEKYSEYVVRLIQKLKTTKFNNILDDNDISYENLWFEFSFHIKEENDYLDEFETTVRQFIFHFLKVLPDTEKKLLWLITDDYFEYIDSGFHPVTRY